MGLAESQKLLARLSTDPTLRARLAETPEQVAAEFGLTLEETRGFEALLPGPIQEFAGSLIRKRRGELESLLPLTFRSLGPERFARLFRRHASEYVPNGIKKHRDDAIAFAGFLAREIADPPWLKDLGRLEATTLLAYDPTRRWTFLRLRHHPANLARASAESSIEPKPSLIIWFRILPRSRLRRVVLSRPW
jgi:hypothetical protein